MITHLLPLERLSLFFHKSLPAYSSIDHRWGWMELPRILWEKSYIYIYFYTYQTTISKIQQNRSSGQHSIDFMSIYSSSTALNAPSIIQQAEGHWCPRRDTISSCTRELAGTSIAGDQGSHPPRIRIVSKAWPEAKKIQQLEGKANHEDQVFGKIHSKSCPMSMTYVFLALVNHLLPQEWPVHHPDVN